MATPDATKPTTPSNVTASSSAPNSATVSWTASTDIVGVTSYTITQGTTVVGKVNGSATSFTDYTTAPGTAYTYTVTASDAAGNPSQPSSGANATTPPVTPPPDTQKPTPPTGLTATAGPIKEIDLAWTASSDPGGHVAGYNVRRDGTVIATTYSVSYKDTALAAGSHTYTVSAFDGANNTSDPSTGATAIATAALPGAVTYTYDLADRLISIAAPSGSTTSFTLDALGRHASQTITGSPVSTYAYLGTTDIVVAISSNSTTTVSAIDALGSRVATSSGGSFGYLLGDLHGNQAAAFNAAGTAVSDAFAYDAWGVVVASVTSALPTPWRYGGRMLESAPGTPDLYDFAARSYNPALGTFTSLDSHLGSAQNTALLNGYLYANANPATLVDPDGHCSMYDNMRASSTCGTNAADIQSAGEAAGLTGSGDMSRDVYNSQPHFSGSGDMGKDVYKAQQVKSDPQFIGSGDMSTDINNWRENQQLAASWAASSHNDMGSAAYTAMTHKQYGVATNDASARNIAAEDNYTFYSGLCQHGDQSACATMQTIPVNATDARPVGDAIQEGTKDEAEKLIKDLPDGPAKTWLGRLLKVSSGLIKAVNIIEMINDAWAAYDTGGAGAASKVILMDTYKLDVAVGAMAACGGPEDGVGIVCGIAGAWVGDQTAGVVGWGIDQLAGWGPKW